MYTRYYCLASVGLLKQSTKIKDCVFNGVMQVDLNLPVNWVKEMCDCVTKMQKNKKKQVVVTKWESSESSNFC